MTAQDFDRRICGLCADFVLRASLVGLKHMNCLEVARVVAEGWRKLDASVISEVLADNVTYTSMWVFQTLEGKAAYLEYLTRKFMGWHKGQSLLT